MLAGYETQEYTIPVAGKTVRLLGPKHPHSLRGDPKVEQRFLEDGYLPYWATPWQGALMLAEYMTLHVEPGPQPVLELGAGLGLVGVALALAGHRVVVTDYDQDALAFAQASARLNGVELHEVKPLDWRHPPEESYATIVGGDVLYEKRSHQPIAALIARCLRPHGAAFISDLNRPSAETFPDTLHAAGLGFETLAVQSRAIPRPDAVDGRVFKGTIYRIFREDA
jgi:predicted nicotinamide N-methyase